jgi:hypothetical protein
MQHLLTKRQSRTRRCAAFEFAGCTGGYFGQPGYTGGVVAMNMHRLMVHRGHKLF